ncbi:hypothetical protein E4U42_007416 [Claviceps africana]|uniref:Mitochondrial K+-H+ exchange-related-domain-containing protein n=1 Tax=Claviceps africana TaxID=83212 RepID=A0A8K0J1D4_9HYPO|nr:hypothetical protein E4U42_007416 [Claviceps africana]
MRLFLLPLSTRRSFLYAQHLRGANAATDASYIDRGAAWAAGKWSEWERKESGWQKKVVEYGNHAFRRIPYEEWGLKSVPPLSSRRPRRRGGEDEQNMQSQDGQEHVELVFPSSVMSEAQAEDVVRRMGSERDGLHRRRLIWCVIGMPITVPFAVVPIIPNLPFFYLVYRAWSHWRALAGGRHVQLLLDKKLLRPTPSPVLDALYSQAGTLQQTQAHTSPGSTPHPSPDPTAREVLLLRQAQVRTFSEKLGVPALEVELERALWQVEQVMEKEAKGEEEADKEKHS